MMPTKDQIDQLTEKFQLTPYQAYILAKNGYKYDLGGLVKRGDVLYAPYRCRISSGFGDWCAKIIHGPRADLIGSDRLFVHNTRGIKLYPAGFHKAMNDRVLSADPSAAA